MALGPVLGALVRIKRPDVPGADAEDVGHARDASAIIALQSQSNPVIPLDSVAIATVSQAAASPCGRST